MNKQELIKKYEHMNHDCFRRVDVSEVLSDLIRLDKPQKPVVPQYIADFITEQKKHGLTLSYSIDASMSDGVAEWYWDNPELFARAWLDGYEVEKEKRYLVKVKNVLTRQGALNRNKKSGRFIFSNPEENNLYDTKFTREELEGAGFGWVFDCPGIEVEEVKG